MQTVNENQLQTTTSDYGAFYYGHCCGSPYERNEEWLAFFGNVANRIVSEISPKKVLDAGCAKGFLVEMLRSKGADAFGVDISQHAIDSAHENVRPYVKVQNLVDLLGGFYDLIVSIEVLEHMNVRDAEAAIANICAHTNDVLFSSSPFDYEEPTHINVHPSHYWSVLFARNGFYRDVDYDASFITPWTVRYRRRPFLLNEDGLYILQAFERRFWELQQSSLGARKYSRDLQTQIVAFESKTSESTAQVSELESKCDALQHELSAVRQELEVSKQDLEASKKAQDAVQRELLETSNKLQSLTQRHHEISIQLSQKSADYEALQHSLDEILRGRWWKMRSKVIPFVDFFRQKRFD